MLLSNRSLAWWGGQIFVGFYAVLLKSVLETSPPYAWIGVCLCLVLYLRLWLLHVACLLFHCKTAALHLATCMTPTPLSAWSAECIYCASRKKWNRCWRFLLFVFFFSRPFFSWQFFIMLLIIFLLELTVVILFFVYTDKVSQILHFSFPFSKFLCPFSL